MEGGWDLYLEGRWIEDGWELYLEGRLMEGILRGKVKGR